MTDKPKRNWAAWSGWAGVAIVLVGAYGAWNIERGEAREQRKTISARVETIKDARAVRNSYVDNKLESFSSTLARLEERSVQAARERQEIKQIMRRIWGAVRRNRGQR